ncbi:class I SAM-dependent methyltransferase [Frankia sp. CNm7]|uniref:Class I SAM-dependent methyltransferase n=1 Tax=Frankia nepalensis TaxID=1836974 RepID=A0A937RNU2_9ACTN|nr:class I SAM-dependent methyltransferase [Frankia nepalensis]MBL7495996.1 class I SAM-dependent methyltransferase [Frankia nepalensis]MBL7514968.1 class I SAM-dependent methyltransferase [Frankia nepalensis]MBL7519199.1 class I SAM-dependent methyltransferase [Frankia nepalensis]MBL7633457.1 class I SAM-dependent methyltransferase [Frankia nepalensis]
MSGEPASATEVTSCRSCGGERLRPFLSLGATPIANRLVRADALDEADPSFPLEVGFCEDCALVQLTHVLPADEIFDEDYPYFSSFSDMLVRHAEKNVIDLIESRDLGPNSLVVEVASNDGYLLKAFVERGIPVLGIEPTPGPAAAAREVGVPTREEFFGAELAQRLVDEGLRADVIIANNVMAHVPDLNSFVEGFSILLKDDGVVSVENPGLHALFAHTEFDTVYHEHFCYFSTIAVEALVRRHGLELVGVTEFPELHGGTLRWRSARAGALGGGAPDESVARVLGAERAAGFDSFERYGNFGAEVGELQRELLALLTDLRAQGKTIAAYGAAAKGATLLNSTGINTDLIDFVVDRNVHKQGKYMPGARLPILPPEALLERQPDYLLLLAWNVKNEIMAQQSEYASRGGSFIVPVPRPVVL